MGKTMHGLFHQGGLSSDTSSTVNFLCSLGQVTCDILVSISSSEKQESEWCTPLTHLNRVVENAGSGSLTPALVHCRGLQWIVPPYWVSASTPVNGGCYLHDACGTALC